MLFEYLNNISFSIQLLYLIVYNISQVENIIKKLHFFSAFMKSFSLMSLSVSLILVFFHRDTGWK